ncbi:hypothetical protein ACFQH5_00290 [Halomonas salifodinae]|uniref:Uncharacterized protein n=1 Tax=Halomonas salifodinae TaxID=438745 RepID=A0ABW2EV37_9GAMM
MTRKKKTRSLADRVTIRTGRRKDYKKWRHENPDEVGSSQRFQQKKVDQRKRQAERKQARQEQAPQIEIHPKRPDKDDE